VIGVSPIRVVGADPHRIELVSQWLAGAALGAPPGLEIGLATSDSAWTGTDPRPVLRQPDLRFHHGAPDHSVRVVWRDGTGHTLIPAGARRATVDLTREAARDPERWLRPFLLPVILVLLRRAGWHHIHAATARDPRGRGWLIAGDARSGKSTTAALLASRGWAVGTDDTAFLEAETDPVSVAAWREPIALRDGGRDLLAQAGGLPLSRRQKTGFTPEDLGGSWLERVPIDIVALSAVHDGPTCVAPLARSVAVGELLSWSRFFVLEPALAQEHMDLVARLVKRAACYRLSLGRDIFERPDLLRDLVP
jgi:hypothetical protein